MKKTLRAPSLLCALLLLCPMAAVAQGSQEPSAAQIITENSPLDLSPYEGKAIFLNFFTEWCPYCMEEMTFFEDKNLALSAGVGLQGYPTSIFLNKDGSVAAAANHALDYDTMAKALDKMGVAKKTDNEPPQP